MPPSCAVRTPTRNSSVTGIEAARALPGVRGVFVASDFAALGEVPCIAKVPDSDGSMTPAKPYPVMAGDAVHHVGDIVAMVVADTPWQARDAVEALVVDWEAAAGGRSTRRPPFSPARPRFIPARPAISPTTPQIGDKARTDAIFDKAAHVARVKVVNQRLVANYMEPRARGRRIRPRLRSTDSAARKPGRPRVRKIVAGAHHEDA